MKTIEISKRTLDVLQGTIPANTPVTMLNMLKYTSRTKYKDSENFEDCSGTEAYFERYIPKFTEVAESLNITGIGITYLGNVLGDALDMDPVKWDNIALIEYPDMASFMKLISSEKYLKEAEPHRLVALEDWRLLISLKIKV